MVLRGKLQDDHIHRKDWLTDNNSNVHREDNLHILEERCKDSGVKPEDIWWYGDLRRYGTVPHAGFGLGFERLIMFVTGLENIRDVISFPRVPGHAEF